MGAGPCDLRPSFPNKAFNRLYKVKPFIFGHFRQLSDLRTSSLALNKNKRERVPVLIIDDKPFNYLESLRNEHFNLTQHTDIEDVKSVEPYPVVICDILGVGEKLDKEKGGAYVVRIIKKEYPFKKVAVYSSGTYDVDLFSDLQGVKVIKKDPDKDTWRSYIDELIDLATNPIHIWKDIRAYLLQKEVSIIDVAYLEHEYVSLVLAKSTMLEHFPSKSQFPNLSDDLRDIVKSMIAGGLLKLLGV